MIKKKLFARLSWVENKSDAVIARPPWIEKQRAAGCFKMRNVRVTQIIKSISQRLSPCLIPSRLTAGVATAVANPATDAVNATPGSTFAFRSVIDLYIEFRRMLFEILAVVRDRETAGRRFFRKSMGQTYVAEFEMMTIGFAIRGDVEHLLPGCCLGKSID